MRILKTIVLAAVVGIAVPAVAHAQEGTQDSTKAKPKTVVQKVGKTVKKASKDTYNTSKKALHDTGKEAKRTGTHVEKETHRTGKHVKAEAKRATS